MDREDPSDIVLLSCDEGIYEQLSDQAAGDLPYIIAAYFPVCCESPKKPRINAEEQEDVMRCLIISNAPGNLGKVKAVKMQLCKQIRRGKPREGGTVPLWSIIHTFPSRLEIFPPTFLCICPPSTAVYLYLNYSVICQRSCVTSYPFPGTPHRRRWRNEAWQTRTLSSASKWSKSPQPPKTNTWATRVPEWPFFWPSLIPGGRARWRSTKLVFEPAKRGRRKRILQRKPALTPPSCRKDWFEA